MITVAVTFALTLTGEVGRFYAVVGARARRAVRRPGARAACATPTPQARDPVLRVVERLPDAGVRRRCRRRPHPLSAPAALAAVARRGARSWRCRRLARDPGRRCSR